jgi:hypothetical protein
VVSQNGLKKIKLKTLCLQLRYKCLFFLSLLFYAAFALRGILFNLTNAVSVLPSVLVLLPNHVRDVFTELIRPNSMMFVTVDRKGGYTHTDKIGVGAGVDIVVAISTTQVWCTHIPKKSLLALARRSIS